MLELLPLRGVSGYSVALPVRPKKVGPAKFAAGAAPSLPFLIVVDDGLAPLVERQVLVDLVAVVVRLLRLQLVTLRQQEGVQLLLVGVDELVVVVAVVLAVGLSLPGVRLVTCVD